MAAKQPDSPSIFISYSHDSQDHERRVLALADRLREGGLRVALDQDEPNPVEGWPRWMEKQIRKSDFVLMVCTETYGRRVMGEEKPGKGLGALWEGNLIYNQLYGDSLINRKFLPLLFDPRDEPSIPAPLRSYTYFRIPQDYDKLVRTLVNRPMDAKTVNYSKLIYRQRLEGEGSELFSIAFSPDGSHVAAGSDADVYLWDMNSVPPTRTVLQEHESYVYSVAFSRDGRYLASTGEDRAVVVWDVHKRQKKWKRIRGHREAIYSVAFSPDGDQLATGGYDRTVNIWRADNGQVERQQDRSLDRIGRITSVAFSADGRLLAIGSLNDEVTLWDLQDRSAHVLEGHTSSVETVAFSPDGRLLASAGLDKTVRVWDVESRKLRWLGKEHEYLVRSVAFSPDGTTLASASWDKTVRLWSAEKGGHIALLPIPMTAPSKWHSDWIWSVAFSHDGMVLASSGSDGAVILYSVR